MSLKNLAHEVAKNSVKRSLLHKSCHHVLSDVPVLDPIGGHILRPDAYYLPCKLCGVFFLRSAGVRKRYLSKTKSRD